MDLFLLDGGRRGSEGKPETGLFSSFPLTRLRPQPDQESRKRGKQEGLSRSQDAFDLKGIYARISRRLRLLRAHGVIRKISKTHRDRPTEHGQLLTASQFAAREASVKGLLAKAS